jgi:hypothetical protein
LTRPDGQVPRGERPGRTHAERTTYFKNCAFWGIAAVAIGGLIYDRLLAQARGMVLDFNPFEYFDEDWQEG